MPEPLRRHQLVFVDADKCGGMNWDKKIGEWFAAGLPGIARRPCISKENNICLGIPFPPSQGKLRLSCEVPEDAILKIKKPPTLKECAASIPVGQAEALKELQGELEKENASVYAVGSLAWETITGFEYLTKESDIDLLFIVKDRNEFEKVNRILERWHPEANGKYDIEIMLPDGQGFLWKEYKQLRGKMLIKGNSKLFAASLEQLLP